MNSRVEQTVSEIGRLEGLTDRLRIAYADLEKEKDVEIQQLKDRIESLEYSLSGAVNADWHNSVVDELERKLDYSDSCLEKTREQCLEKDKEIERLQKKNEHQNRLLSTCKEDRFEQGQEIRRLSRRSESAGNAQEDMPSELWAVPLDVKIVCSGEYHEDAESGGTRYIRADLVKSKIENLQRDLCAYAWRP